ncbi:STAS domain-containing protein, partial [Micromonosporaceae bacterium Da 78-11]
SLPPGKRRLTEGRPMADFSVDVRTDVDGSLVVRPRGDLDSDCAVEFRQVLVHSVRKVRPLRLVLDLSDVRSIDPINLGTLAALCDLADDHQVVVFLDDVPAPIADRVRAAGVPPQRLRYNRSTVIVDTPAVASMS